MKAKRAAELMATCDSHRGADAARGNWTGSGVSGNGARAGRELCCARPERRRVGRGRRSSPTSPAGLRALTAAEMHRSGGRNARAVATRRDRLRVDELRLRDRLRRRRGSPREALAARQGFRSWRHAPPRCWRLRVLGVERIALVDPPWFDAELNELGAAYFRGQGFDVVSSASADLSQDPRQIDAASVFEWASRNVVDEMEAVFMAGNGFRAAAAIAPLEAALGRPVLTSNQVLLWNVLAKRGQGSRSADTDNCSATNRCSAFEAVKPSSFGESLASEPD